MPLSLYLLLKDTYLKSCAGKQLFMCVCQGLHFRFDEQVIQMHISFSLFPSFLLLENYFKLYFRPRHLRVFQPSEWASVLSSSSLTKTLLAGFFMFLLLPAFLLSDIFWIITKNSMKECLMYSNSLGSKKILRSQNEILWQVLLSRIQLSLCFLFHWYS